MAAGQSGSRLSRFVDYGKKIICVARNYADHAKELGNALPSEPVFFLKPTTAYLKEGTGKIRMPPGCSSLHHEVELGLVIGKSGTNISEANAMDFVGGYALALDMTARDLQNKAKEKRHPWTLAKAFDTSCPVSDLIPKESITDVADVNLWLKVGEETRQNGNTKDMIFNSSVLISFISRYMTLEEGDLILTGTPSGVGPVKSGDVITAGVGDLAQFKFTIE